VVTLRTIGQPGATAAVAAMLGGRSPHAVLLSGPPSVGKRSLAADLSAGLLCVGATGADRPCRECRGCRMVDHGNHPDLHRLEPEGPGGMVGIGGPGRARGVRDLVAELALMPVEGGHRVAVIGDAQRMTEDAQSALLKTLEEPPADTTLILVADDEERLLPTVRSRCARVRLGTVGPRDIERLLEDLGVADAPTAARLARLTGGRPGVAVAYATAPDAMIIRGEIARILLDLLDLGPEARLAASRELMGRGARLSAMLATTRDEEPVAAQPGRAGTARGADTGPSDEPEGVAERTGSDKGEAEPAPGRKASASDRRRALTLILDLWLDLARDLALAARGATGSMRDMALLEDLETMAARTEPGAVDASLTRLTRARELVDANVSPELVLDVALLRWPAAKRAA
jgi:DNA polymerase III subunit delta'